MAGDLPVRGLFFWTEGAKKKIHLMSDHNPIFSELKPNVLSALVVCSWHSASDQNFFFANFSHQSATGVAVTVKW
jgi:hypothetical protein